MVKEPITETLATEQAATLYAGDETEFDFPAEFPLTYVEKIEHRQKKDAYIKRRLSEKNTPYKETGFVPFGDKT
jgi:hypothetical protein